MVNEKQIKQLVIDKSQPKNTSKRSLILTVTVARPIANASSQVTGKLEKLNIEEGDRLKNRKYLPSLMINKHSLSLSNKKLNSLYIN